MSVQLLLVFKRTPLRRTGLLAKKNEKDERLGQDNMKTLILILVAILTSCTSVPTKAWNSKSITYSFVNESYKLNGVMVNPIGTKLNGVSVTDAKSLFRRAIHSWQSQCGLSIVEALDGPTVQIRISESDISGTIAGYGNYPSSYYQSGGDLYIDSSRQWTKSLLYKVALHEIGHTIGLSHTVNRKSIMYYKVTNVDKLSSIDISRLRRLYGLNKGGK